MPTPPQMSTTTTNNSVRFVSSSAKIPRPPTTRCQLLSKSPPLLITSSSSSSSSLRLLLRKLTSTALGIIRSSPLTKFCFASLSTTYTTNDITTTWSPRKDHLHLDLKQQQQQQRPGKEEEERVLISEVLIRNKDGEELIVRPDLAAEAASALKFCRPNSALTVGEVQEDVARIIGSGFFCSCMPVAFDTRDGIRLVFQVEPNQEFRGLICDGANVLPAKFLEDSFRDGYGKIVNLRRLDEVIGNINGWYAERGLFGMVSDAEILSGGIIRLAVSEAEVNNITMQFLDKRGEPTTGKTKRETIVRQLTTKKGQVYSLLQGKRDVDTILTMGIMEDVSIVPQPAGDTGKVDLLMNLVERDSRGFSAGGGFSSGIRSGPLSGLIGSFAYSHRNVFGRNQKLNLSLERGQMDSIYRINYTDPWIEGDNKRTSRSFTLQNSRTPGTLVHGGDRGQGNVTVEKVTAGIEYSRPLRPKWSGTSGITFQRARARDDQARPIIKDFYNSPLTASGNEYDDSLVAKAECVYTGSGDQVILNAEQGIPFLPDWLSFSRVTSRVRKGLEFGPTRFVLSLSGGHVLGRFSPHEAFTIGGINSVRGYEEGAVGSGRSYVIGYGEVSFPLFGPLEGVAFTDYGSDLGSGPTVPGDPAGARGKPGSGFGFGAGIRVNSPLGPLRLEYAVNDRRATRFHLGVGQRN